MSKTRGRFARLGQELTSSITAVRLDLVPVPEPRERHGLVDVVIGESITSTPSRWQVTR